MAHSNISFHFNSYLYQIELFHVFVLPPHLYLGTRRLLLQKYTSGFGTFPVLTCDKEHKNPSEIRYNIYHNCSVRGNTVRCLRSAHGLTDYSRFSRSKSYYVDLKIYTVVVHIQWFITKGKATNVEITNSIKHYTLSIHVLKPCTSTLI